MEALGAYSLVSHVDVSKGCTVTNETRKMLLTEFLHLYYSSPAGSIESPMCRAPATSDVHCVYIFRLVSQPPI